MNCLNISYYYEYDKILDSGTEYKKVNFYKLTEQNNIATSNNYK